VSRFAEPDAPSEKDWDDRKSIWLTVRVELSL
jgi:hypothetical protein